MSLSATHHPRRRRRVVIVGAGVGGLTAAMLLAARGLGVTVIEQASRPGGKMSGVDLAGHRLDSGPTVLTLKSVFEEIFSQSGADLAARVALRPLSILARHAWPDGSRLDLHASRADSAAAIADLAGRREADGYLDLCRDAERIYRRLEAPFLRARAPSLARLIGGAGLRGLPQLAAIRPFATLWRALDRYFTDPRLKQLFGRYATYSGASPFAAPATLMLIAHVEQAGVWSVAGGLYDLAEAMQAVARERGASFRYNTAVDAIVPRMGRVAGVRLADGEFVPSDAVVVNADAGAVAQGLLGAAPARALPGGHRSRQASLSAVTWALLGRAEGFALARHNVFFSGDYAAEFDDIFTRGRLPRDPTVYLCAQDRDAAAMLPPGGEERFLCLVNAPANAAGKPPDAMEIEQCESRIQSLLDVCGLRLHPTGQAVLRRGPADYAALFPGSGGALYGPAMHGWQAAFRRPATKTRLPGLYLAGGGVHPGPGVPMAALSGKMAAARLLEDFPSTLRSRPAAMAGGISTR